MTDDHKPAYLSERWRGPGTPRLLLVDDDDVMRRSTVRFLSRAGFEVVSVGSGAAALTLIDEGERFDVAVIDLEMPGMDGVELMRAISKREVHLPMGLWSASQRLEELSREELALAWFVKPKMRPIGELVQAICQAVYGDRTPLDGEAGGQPRTGGNGHSGNGAGGGNGRSDARPGQPTGVRRRSEVRAMLEVRQGVG
ncbi:MAG TPA: response regulator [Sandaracinaceae bacterium LLY-WYZ-13_1]|nr:response regulator [Sandaracinaceae bacterium LLY-WYZ-13_1]